MSTGPLDPRFDPDRYDPDRDGRDRAPEPPPELPRGLDPRNDPDRFDNKNLVELIGKDATYEDERDGAA